MKSLFSLLLILVTIQISSAQNTPCPCCTDNHKQFDFWVGDWIVYDTLGKQVGTNLIEKLERGCIVSENWKGTSGSTGKSYNYYNRTDSTWNQVWIDNSGWNLVMKGKAEENKMILRSETTKDSAGNYVYNRVTWRKNEDESVTQLWESVDKNGKVIAVAFHGIYKKKG